MSVPAPDLLVFTWNLDSNIEAAKLAIAHLQSRVDERFYCIAAFQEAPDGIDDLVANAATLSAHPKVTPTEEIKSRRNVVVTSHDIKIDPEGPVHTNLPVLDKGRRMEGRTFVSEHWSGLRFLAVHGWDQWSQSSEGERAEWAGIVRTLLTSFWTAGPLIVAGDLNANPWHREVTYRRGWFASRAAEQRQDESYQLSGVEIRAKQLMNPMWNVVANARLPGTFYYEHEDMLWHCLDQVLVSKALFTPSLSPVILETMMSTALLDANRKPRHAKDRDGKKKHVFSDHLPVELIIPGEVAKRACNKANRAA